MVDYEGVVDMSYMEAILSLVKRFMGLFVKLLRVIKAVFIKPKKEVKSETRCFSYEMSEFTKLVDCCLLDDVGTGFATATCSTIYLSPDRIKGIEKWDGKLPVQMIPNATVPFLDLNQKANSDFNKQ